MRDRLPPLIPGSKIPRLLRQEHRIGSNSAITGTSSSFLPPIGEKRIQRETAGSSNDFLAPRTSIKGRKAVGSSGLPRLKPPTKLPPLVHTGQPGTYAASFGKSRVVCPKPPPEPKGQWIKARRGYRSSSSAQMAGVVTHERTKDDAERREAKNQNMASEHTYTEADEACYFEELEKSLSSCLRLLRRRRYYFMSVSPDLSMALEEDDI